MKNEEKVLISKLLLKITFISLCISIGLKLLGLNIFEADNSNKLLSNFSNFIESYNLRLFLDFILLLFQTFLIFKLSCKNKNNETYYIATIVSALAAILSQYFLFVVLNLRDTQLGAFLYFVFSMSFLIGMTVVIDIRQKKEKKSFIIKIWSWIKKPFLVMFMISLYQVLVMFLRNITYIDRYDSLYNFLLNFDYIILLLATYYLFLKNEVKNETTSIFDISITKFLNERLSIEDIKVLVLGIKEKYEVFKKSKKVDKIVIVLYLFFFMLSEFFNLGIIIFVAYLNHSLIECFFIITSFTISRKVFGAFHLDSAIKCWLVSNLSFFILNKITLNINVTFVIPILCGIALSYITSRFIKKTTKSLYRGMTETDLLDICKRTKINSLEKNILIDFYCNRINMTKLTYKYNYSRSQLYRYKSNAEKKILGT